MLRILLLVLWAVLSWAAPALALLSGNGVSVSNGIASTDSTSAGFLSNSSSLSCSSSAGKLIVDSTSDTLSYCSSGGSTVKFAALGNDSGDATGIVDGTIVNADVGASAGIALSKLANMATDRLLGRDTASSGAIEELTVGGGLEFTGSGGIQRSAFSGGDVTASAGSGTLSIATGAIVNADINAAAAIDVSKTALAAGFGLDLSGNSLSVNGTEWTGPQVWGDGSGTMSWTFNAGVADPIIDFYGDGTVDVTGALKINTVPVVTESGTQTLTSKTLTSPTVNTPQLNLTNSTTPSPTAEGRVEWDSDTHILAVGNGGSTSYAASGDSTGAATLLASNVVSSGKVQDGTLAANDMTEGFISSYAGTGLTTDTGTSPDTLKIANDGITEAMLKAVDAPSDEECLTYEATGGDFEWQACGSGGGITGLTGDSGGTTTGSTVTLTGGAGITTTRSSDTVTVATASTEQDFLAQSASLSCAGTTPGKLIVDTTTQTLSYCPTGSTTTKYAALGDDNGRATFINATSCTNGVQTASDGTPSCLSAASTPEYVARTMTAGATVAAYAVVMADGSDDDEVIEATTSTTQILGCSQSGSSVTSTNPLSVAVAGVARCKADATVTAGSLVKLGATGEFALATTAEKTWGRAVTDDDGAGSAYVLLFDGAEGTIDHALDLWTSIPDLTSNTLSIINANPTVSMTSTGTLNGVNFAPAFTTSGIGLLTGFNFQPTYSHSSLVSQLYGFNMVGTYTSTDGSGALAASIMRNNATYTSSTANAEPFSSLIAVDDKPVISNTTATTSTSTPTSYITIRHGPVISINDADGATGGLAAMTLTDDKGFVMGGTYTETSGTLAVTNRVGFQYDEVTNTSTATAITNNIGVDIAALGAAGATNNIGIRNADTTVYTPTTQAIAAAATTISPAASVVCLTADANYDISNNPQISDGVDGQMLTLMNCDSSTQTITLEDGDGLQLMGNNSAVLSAGDAITFVYTTASATADWYEVSRTNAEASVFADLPAAGCVAAAAASFWDLPSSNAPAAACYGTNYPRGVLDFDAATDETAYTSVMLPTPWTGVLYADIYWFATATTNETQWGVQVVCAGSSEPSDPAFNTVSTVSTTVDGTTTDVTKSTVTVATTTGCSAGEMMHVKLYRDADAGGGVDDMTGDARLLRMVLRQ